MHDEETVSLVRNNAASLEIVAVFGDSWVVGFESWASIMASSHGLSVLEASHTISTIRVVALRSPPSVTLPALPSGQWQRGFGAAGREFQLGITRPHSLCHPRWGERHCESPQHRPPGISDEVALQFVSLGPVPGCVRARSFCSRARDQHTKQVCKRYNIEFCIN